jgi:hypothetical protein
MLKADGLESPVAMPKKDPEDKNKPKGYSAPPGLDDAVVSLGVRLGGIKKSVLVVRAIRWFLHDVKAGSPRATTDPRDQWAPPEESR